MRNILLYIVIGFGLVGIFLFSHELYHYFTVKGGPTGVCLGNCKLNENMSVAGYIRFENLTMTKQESIANERNADIFAWIITLLIGISLGYLYRK